MITGLARDTMAVGDKDSLVHSHMGCGGIIQGDHTWQATITGDRFPQEGKRPAMTGAWDGTINVTPRSRK